MPLWQDKLFIGLAQDRERRHGLLPDPDRTRGGGRHAGHRVSLLLFGPLDVSFGRSMTDIALIRPSLDWLPVYGDALERGWSPNTDQDVSREQLLQLRRNPERFPPRSLQQPDGPAAGRAGGAAPAGA